MILMAVFPPSCVVTVIVALPAAIAVTSPVLSTVATDVLPELQVIFLFVASDGKTKVVNCWVAFTEMVADVGVTLTPVAGVVVVKKSA